MPLDTDPHSVPHDVCVSTKPRKQRINQECNGKGKEKEQSREEFFSKKTPLAPHTGLAHADLNTS